MISFSPKLALFPVMYVGIKEPLINNNKSALRVCCIIKTKCSELRENPGFSVFV